MTWSTTGTFTHSTLKSKECDSSKFTSSAADTEAVADGGKGVAGTGGGDDKEVIELIARLPDGERKASHYDVPNPLANTMFGVGGAN